jgi:hypothetical protein
MPLAMSARVAALTTQQAMSVVDAVLMIRLQRLRPPVVQQMTLLVTSAAVVVLTTSSHTNKIQLFSVPDASALWRSPGSFHGFHGPTGGA